MTVPALTIDLASGVHAWSRVRLHAERVLADAGVEHPRAEARWMVERAGGAPAAGSPAPGRAVRFLVEMLGRRVAGEPLQYVLGRWSFRHLELFVDRRALIPRPETEVTAEVALEEAERLGLRRGSSGGRAVGGHDDVVVDLGTGSGPLALALADELPDAQVWATDVSEGALALARANLALVGLAASRVRLARGSWFEALPELLRGHVRLVVSNPPYVAEHELPALPPEVRDHEPRVALVSGPRGTEALDAVVLGSAAWLDRGGTLVCELAPSRVHAAVAMADAAGFAEAFVRPDLTGRDRVLVARRRAGPTPQRRGAAS